MTNEISHRTVMTEKILSKFSKERGSFSKIFEMARRSTISVIMFLIIAVALPTR